jgi:hypothetical protein
MVTCSSVPSNHIIRQERLFLTISIANHRLYLRMLFITCDSTLSNWQSTEYIAWN